MAAMSDYLEGKLIDHCFRGVAFTAPAALYIGLLTSLPSTDANAAAGTEVSGGSYARIALAPSTTNWAAPSAGNGLTSNSVAITFNPGPTAAWGVIQGFGIYDAASAGNLMWWGALSVSKTVNSGDAAPSFQANALTITIDN